MLRNRPFNLDNSFIKLFARCANLIILHIPAIFHLKPATYTGNWFRLPLSNTSQAGWRLRRRGWFRRPFRWAYYRGAAFDRTVRNHPVGYRDWIDRSFHIARRNRGIRWWTLTEGYNYTQSSQGNHFFFHYKSQEANKRHQLYTVISNAFNPKASL